jgi:hypothetical protein
VAVVSAAGVQAEPGRVNRQPQGALTDVFGYGLDELVEYAARNPCRKLLKSRVMGYLSKPDGVCDGISHLKQFDKFPVFQPKQGLEDKTLQQLMLRVGLRAKAAAIQWHIPRIQPNTHLRNRLK